MPVPLVRKLVMAGVHSQSWLCFPGYDDLFSILKNGCGTRTRKSGPAFCLGLKPSFQEAQDLRHDEAHIATRFVQWIAHPKMGRVGHRYKPHKELGLLQR